MTKKHVGCCTKVKFCFNDLVGLGIVSDSKSLPDNYSEITIVLPTNKAIKIFDKLGQIDK